MKPYYKFLLSLLMMTFFATAADKPNILWLVSEDNGARWLGSYGNPAKPTPTLDKLASEGFRFTNTYASVPVCAPQRFTWLTGINAISAGTQGMRSNVVIPKSIKYYPEIFQELGYYTSKGANKKGKIPGDGKTDYNSKGVRTSKDEKSREAHQSWNDGKALDWDTLKENQPFMHVINTHDTHESRSFGAFNPNKDNAPKAKNRAAYHPDIPEVDYVYEKYNECHRKMDKTVAMWLKDLEDSGLAENTIVVYSSDHGGVLPRSKRYLYNSGTHCPLIVRIPKKFKHLYPAEKPGMVVDELVSFTDFPKTFLSLGGAQEKDLQQMQGRVFLGDKKNNEPKHIFSFRGRMDERLDMVRSVRDRELLYMRNYMPFVPVGQYLAYLHNSAAMRAWWQHHKDGKTDEITGRYFKQPRDIDELYNSASDYDNVKNLAFGSKNAAKIKEMRAALRAWQLSIFDSGFLPEDEINREAAKAGLLVYDYVRDPKLYPLESYIDMADLSLEVDLKNIPNFLEGLKSEYIGLRYWSTLGLLNLTFFNEISKPTIVIAAMKERLKNEKSEVIRAYTAWLLVRLGEVDSGVVELKKLAFSSYSLNTVYNNLDWMKPEVSLPISAQVLLYATPQKDDRAFGNSMKVLVNNISNNSSPELAILIAKRQKAVSLVKTKKNRLKNLAVNKDKYPEDRLAREKVLNQKQYDKAVIDAASSLEELRKLFPRT